MCHSYTVGVNGLIKVFSIFLVQRKDDFDSEEFGESGIDHDFVRITYDIVLSLVLLSDYNNVNRASDRMRKKIKDYAEILGHIMRKHALIMRKLHWIMQKFKQFTELIIRPIQYCIFTCLWYM